MCFFASTSDGCLARMAGRVIERAGGEADSSASAWTAAAKATIKAIERIVDGREAISPVGDHVQPKSAGSHGWTVAFPVADACSLRAGVPCLLAAAVAAVSNEQPRTESLCSAALYSAATADTRALSVSLPLLVAAPSAHAAAVSPQAVQKSRAIYGSRVFRLQKASPDFILEEKNAFTLFISGCYSTTADKPTRIQLEKLEKTALAAAKKGDAAGAQAAVKEFVQLASIKEYDTVPGNVFNQKNACDRQGCSAVMVMKVTLVRGIRIEEIEECKILQSNRL